MVQRPTGEWQSETQPTRHRRREARWALEDASRFRLPIVGKADVPLQTVGAPVSAHPDLVVGLVHALIVCIPRYGLKR